MTLVRHTLGDTMWPDWLPYRGLFDWSEHFPTLSEQDRLRVEEYQENGTLVVRAEMPGIDPNEDVEITVEDGMLRLKAERTRKSETEDIKGYRSEFHYGSFSRAVRLPAGATEDDIEAEYCDGILHVRIPISTEKASAKKIPVQTK